ncbi:MAG: DUF559 domain-containing protein [Acidimicrobiales bacterium]
MNRRAIDALVVSLASRQGMVVTFRQLTEAGVARHDVRSRYGGLLTPVSAGVYVVGELTPAACLHAALAALPSAAVSHRTAGLRHRLPVLAPAHHQELLVAMNHRSRRQLPGVRVRTTRWLPGEDVTVVEGVRVTTLARTICDLGAVVARSRLRHAVELAITEDRVSVGELQACAGAWCRRGRSGSQVIRALDHELLDAEPLPGSELERRGLQLLRGAGIGGWRAQYRPPWYDGVRGVVDLAWPVERVVVELDGRRWHATAQVQGDDRRRDRLATSHGWVTLRFGWAEVVHRPAAFVGEVQEVLGARRPGGG